MRRTLPCCFRHVSALRLNLIQINHATLYRHHPTPNEPEPSSSNPPLFRDLSFNLPAPSVPRTDHHWAVIGPHATTLLEILQGQHICIPPTARTFPYLSSDEIARKDHRLRTPSRAIQHVGFNDGKKGQGVRGAYLSARYESRREDTDWSVLQYLTGDTELNPSEQQKEEHRRDDGLLARVVKDLRLQKLLSMPVSNLSNGQTRRSRIAKALLGRPELLLLDEPFMGLDPPTQTSLSPILRWLAYKSCPLLLLALRPQDPIPDWITHLAILGKNYQVALQGRKEPVLFALHRWVDGTRNPDGSKTTAEFAGLSERFGPPLVGVGATTLTGEGLVEGKHYLHGRNTKSPATATDKHLIHARKQDSAAPLIELSNINVAYGSKPILGPLSLSIHAGSRLALLGPNGSGKTTLLSLLTSDHPQSYSLPIKFFGRTRLPKPGVPGLSLWDVQRRIGHSSPEIHAFFPKHLSVRRTLESSWAEAYLSNPSLSPERIAIVNATLAWWEDELNTTDDGAEDDLSWSQEGKFGELDFGIQRLLLLLRALIKQADIVILDEAFSGLSVDVREKAMMWLEFGQRKTLDPDGKIVDSDVQDDNVGFEGLKETQALIVVSHVREEVPRVVDEWVRLPGEEEEGIGVLRGRCEPGEIRSAEVWNRIWAGRG